MDNKTQQNIKDIVRSITESMKETYIVLAYKLLKEVDANDPLIQKEIGKQVIENIKECMIGHSDYTG